MIFLQIIIYLVLIIVPILVLRYFYKFNLKKKREAWLLEKKYVTLQILAPKNDEKKPLAAEQMFASIHGVFRMDSKFQEQISYEIVARNQYIYLYARVPDELRDFIEGQIYAQYPSVEISEVPDYCNNYDESLKISGAEILLTKADVYPIKTFDSFDVDPLSGITGVLSKIEDTEQVWIQIITRPVSDDWQLRGVNYVSAIRSGRPMGEGNAGSIFKSMIKFIFDVIRAASTPTVTPEVPKSPSEVKLSSPQEEALKGIEQKITKLGFESIIRVVALSKEENTAKNKVNSVIGAFKQFNTTNLNGFVSGGLTSDPSFVKLYQERNFEDHKYVLNIAELASVFHLPTITVETPNIVWAGSKKGEPPSNLPIAGVVPPEELTVFAKANFRHIQHKFGIKSSDRGLHFYAIGKTGTGKSTMLENMIIDDIRMGRGVGVVDPHGELINHILNFVPSSRINDVIYFNPADHEFPVGFNILENVNPDLKNIIASGVVGTFKKIFTAGGTMGAASWGPRLEYILRNVILALLDYPDATLLGVMKVLNDKDFRKDVVSKVKDPVIKDFFINEFEKYDPKFRTEAISPIQNKVGQFLSSSTIRNIVGQPKSSFDMREVMDQGKILLLDLSIGKIGEDSSALLGAMLITKIQLSAMQRADISEKERRDFYLYVDEFQNFATESFAVILSEARKYHLNLIMTNQYIEQMPETVAKAIFGNVGSLISFRVGAQDATSLVKEFEPVFEANDMVNLDNHHIYVKMAIDGVTRPAFSAVTLPPNTEENGNREKIIKVSREHFARAKDFVESKIQSWSGNPTEAPESNEAIGESERKLINGYEAIKDKNGKTWYVGSNDKKEGTESEKSLIDLKELESIAPTQSNNLSDSKSDNKDEMPAQISKKDKDDDKKDGKTKEDLKILKSGETVKVDST